MPSATRSRTSAAQAPPADRTQRNWRKVVLFRLAAILLGLSPLIVFELGLRLAGLGKPTEIDDPFVGFSDVHPLFVLNKPTGRYEIPTSRQTHFRPESFAAVKPAGEFRIFVLGGSTVQGRPYSIETSFPAWLELGLTAADPSHPWEVVNCGGISYASYRLVPILQEVLRYQPDLIIFCEGHNEFLEERTYGDIKSAPALLAWPQRQVARLRTYNVLRQGVLRLTGKGSVAAIEGRPTLGAETDAILDWKNGVEKYHRDPPWHADVTRHFETTLRRIVSIAEDADVPLLIVSPVSNLEWPPFKPEHRASLTSAELDRFDLLMEQAADTLGKNPAEALALWQQAVQIDDQHALVHYNVGICLRELGRMNEARAALVRAKELDVCPLRMLQPLQQLIFQVASETGTPLVDADALIASRSRSGFADNQWLIDHVHPTIEGHQLIATTLVEEMAPLGFVRPQTGWEEARETAYKKRLASLDHAYFERGQTFLRAEQNWARGRAMQERK